MELCGVQIVLRKKRLEMKPLPFTYISRKKLKGGPVSYWRFRHPEVGEVALPSYDDPLFGAVYRGLLDRCGAVVRDARVARAMGINADARNFFQIYFIQAGDNGPIKIGIGKNPVARMMQLQVGNHVELSLIGSTAGGRREEELFHHRYRTDKIRGEWFTRSPALEADIAAILSAHNHSPTKGCLRHE